MRDLSLARIMSLEFADGRSFRNPMFANHATLFSYIPADTKTTRCPNARSAAIPILLPQSEDNHYKNQDAQDNHKSFCRTPASQIHVTPIELSLTESDYHCNLCCNVTARIRVYLQLLHPRLQELYSFFIRLCLFLYTTVP